MEKLSYILRHVLPVLIELQTWVQKQKTNPAATRLRTHSRDDTNNFCLLRVYDDD